MKLPRIPRGGRLVIRSLAMVTLIGQTHADPEIPRGTLSVDSSLVRIGSPAQLAWKIEQPHQPNLIVTEDTQVRVRVLGVSFQLTKNNNGHGNNVDGVDVSNPGKAKKVDSDASVDDENKGVVENSALDLPVEVVWGKNGSAWARLFYGTQSTVVSTDLVLNTTVADGDRIDFGARGYDVDEWLPLYTTSTASPNVIVLKNGDPTPIVASAFRLGQIKAFLKPYLSSDGTTLKIGDKDMIVLMELQETDSTSAEFDLQDLAILVTFD